VETWPGLLNPAILSKISHKPDEDGGKKERKGGKEEPRHFEKKAIPTKKPSKKFEAQAPQKWVIRRKKKRNEEEGDLKGPSERWGKEWKRRKGREAGLWKTGGAKKTKGDVQEKDRGGSKPLRKIRKQGQRKGHPLPVISLRLKRGSKKRDEQ